MILEPGSTLDRYTIEALVGVGAMGKVYRAFDTRLERAVAVKVLEPDGEDSGEAVASTLREARAAAAILHPNATAIFDADRAGEISFIVMELVPGTSLRRFVGDSTVPLDTRVRWLVEIAGALDAAHHAGVVHRDVKPENVIVRDDGLVKVLDFGIARLPRRGPDSFATPSGGGGLVGTPAYMAPEQIRSEELDGRADQFAWGVLAYELVAGRLPWAHPDDALAQISAVLYEEPAPLLGGAPPEIADVVVRALAKAREARYPTMAEVAVALSPFAGPRVPLRSLSTMPPGADALGRAAARAEASTPPSKPVFEEQVAPWASSVVPARAPNAVPTPTAARTPAPTSDVSSSRPALRDPDFAAPVDVDAHLDLLPPTATCKGIFLIDVLRLASSVIPQRDLFHLAGVPERRYVAFRDYPMSENVRITVAAALSVYPALPLGEGLRRIGQTAFDTVTASLIGKTLFGVLGNDLDAILPLGPRAYSLFLNFGELTAERTGPRTHVFRASSFPVFLETYQIGVIEGVLARCCATGRIRIALESLADATVELEVAFRPRTSMAPRP